MGLGEYSNLIILAYSITIVAIVGLSIQSYIHFKSIKSKVDTIMGSKSGNLNEKK